MGYRSDVRIVVTKEGFEELNKYVCNYCDEHNCFNRLGSLDVDEITKKGNRLFGWDCIKWYEDDYDDVDCIMNGLRYVNELGFAYSYARIGEDLEDNETRVESNKNGDTLEWVNIYRSFDVCGY